MSRTGQALLKTLAVTIALLFLFGAVITAMRAVAAGPDAGTERKFFPATKSAPMPPPRARDGGAPMFFPASKSAGGEALPGIKPSPQQQAP